MRYRMLTLAFLGSLVIPTFAPFATAAAPATQPTAAPTGPAGEPLAAVRAMFTAMANSDEEAVFNAMIFNTEAAKREAHALVGEVVMQSLLVKTIAETFHETPTTAPIDPANIEALLRNTTTAIEGDTAEIVREGKSYIFLVRVQGVWKIDFDKTQCAQDGPPKEVRIANSEMRAKVFRSVAADVKANKFKTSAEARTALADAIGKEQAAAADVQANIKKTRATLTNVKTQLHTYEVTKDDIPSNAEGLDALVKIGLLEQFPVDAWGNRIIYANPGKKDPMFDVYSAGPDGKPGTDDDIWPD